MAVSNSTSSGLGLIDGLFLLFLGLKLAGIGVVATWSWWAITAPLWVTFIVAIVGMAIYLAVTHD